ncbi:FtrB [Desulforapulum autotrophicum HRM2]|jgi:ferredoxin-thioredoxin reductase catalytic subunit|uniref:ferredoxin:thioredoxin reductase n=1 Tax=Desulforapulum autotrophicum (strain ATCC 43914 / DSM 3382 / VKM B-1955 / HRM2) TaxID=177437 RepID=C0QCE6_DESAH|nr:ferredoxin-thioredoxin reductase catalytic domain-containing protein [Desulforapulum autotrophicum]ACN17163.1 FtrB [Desulforapulum autotrophicum HRM2]
MEIKAFYEKLRKIHEPKGYFFNNDTNLVYELLEALLQNKETYGYMACPCRLASGDKENDRDIFCPCDYREPDVAEYGSCFCGLYVSKAYQKGQVEPRYVPERRDPDKMF